MDENKSMQIQIHLVLADLNIISLILYSARDSQALWRYVLY